MLQLGGFGELLPAGLKSFASGVAQVDGSAGVLYPVADVGAVFEPVVASGKSFHQVARACSSRGFGVHGGSPAATHSLMVANPLSLTVTGTILRSGSVCCG